MPISRDVFVLYGEDHFRNLQQAIKSRAPAENLTYHYIRAVVVECKGNVSEAARRLGMHRNTLQNMLKRRRPKGRVLEPCQPKGKAA